MTSPPPKATFYKGNDDDDDVMMTTITINQKDRIEAIQSLLSLLYLLLY